MANVRKESFLVPSSGLAPVVWPGIEHTARSFVFYARMATGPA